MPGFPTIHTDQSVDMYSRASAHDGIVVPESDRSPSLRERICSCFEGLLHKLQQFCHHIGHLFWGERSVAPLSDDRSLDTFLAVNEDGPPLGTTVSPVSETLKSGFLAVSGAVENAPSASASDATKDAEIQGLQRKALGVSIVIRSVSKPGTGKEAPKAKEGLAMYREEQAKIEARLKALQQGS